VLSHKSAGDRWGILATSRRSIDVSVETRSGRKRQPGIHPHCVRRLDPKDVTVLHGIPITTPARTLVDLCAKSTASDDREGDAAAAAFPTRR
jgi:predicted transcriptional regulator of viral defense system